MPSVYKSVQLYVLQNGRVYREAVLLSGGMRGRLIRQCVIDGGVSCGVSH